jgi:hypothetical protein
VERAMQEMESVAALCKPFFNFFTMTVKEILHLEATKDNAATILLFREGIFLKAYEVSAYLFHRYVKPYQVNCVYYKNIKKSVISLGFPSRFLDKIVEDGGLTELFPPADGVHGYAGEHLNLADEEFAVFRKNYIYQEMAIALTSPAEAPAETEIHARLRRFQIENKTPMECMIFLNELKSLLYD